MSQGFLNSQQALVEVQGPSWAQSAGFVLSYFVSKWFPSFLTTPERCIAFISLIVPSVVSLCLTQFLDLGSGNSGNWGQFFSRLAAAALLVFVALFCAFIGMGASGVNGNRKEAPTEAMDALSAGMEAKSVVATTKHLVFLPTGVAVRDKRDKVKVKSALIYFPGANVDHRAYSRVALRLAKEHGVLVILVNSEPSRLVAPVFGFHEKFLSETIEWVKETFNVSVMEWALGGHSLGAAHSHELGSKGLLPKTINKLVLHGCFLPPGKDMRKSHLKIMILNGTKDGFYNEPKKKMLIEAMPSQKEPNENGGRLRYIDIEGGNHSGFADYSHQTWPKEDGQRTIPLEEQHGKVAQHTAEFLNG